MSEQEVARLVALALMEPVLQLIESDPHQFGTRSCPTCEAITVIAGRPFGCVAKRRGPVKEER